MDKDRYRPKVLVTLGDPAGIGPEICAGCMMDSEIQQFTRSVLIGDGGALKRGAAAMGIENCRLNRIKTPEEGIFEAGIINFIQPYEEEISDIPFGKMSIQGAKMAYSYITQAIETAREWDADLITTAPINKESFLLAGLPHKDHTAIFNSYYPGIRTESMFHCRELRVFHYTRHMSLKQAIEALDEEKLFESVREINRVLISLGIEKPRIAIAALNPHASDDGMFGDEEEKYLKPAVNRGREAGILVDGPVPADAVFYLQIKGQYDGILSLFHDQGHIACKSYDFEKSVSLTFGLPFMRSTVDHGTAYDLAGKGSASYENIKEAILAGADYCRGNLKQIK